MSDDELKNRITLLEKRLDALEGQGVIDLKTLDPDVLQEAINNGVLNSENVTHRDLVAPRIRKLLEEERYDELEKFLRTYVSKLTGS